MTTSAPIPCGTPVRHNGATWTVMAVESTGGDPLYWISNAARETAIVPAYQVTRLPTVTDSAELARAVRKITARP